MMKKNFAQISHLKMQALISKSTFMEGAYIRLMQCIVKAIRRVWAFVYFLLFQNT